MADMSEPCPVCEAKGGWYRDSGQSMNPKHQEEEPGIRVCFFCHGQRRVVLPGDTTPRRTSE